MLDFGNFYCNHGCLMTDISIVSLFFSLQQLPLLKDLTLYLGDNQISDQGAIKLANSLLQLKGLGKLAFNMQVWGNSLTTIGKTILDETKAELKKRGVEIEEWDI